jgi:hypothetical protein
MSLQKCGTSSPFACSKNIYFVDLILKLLATIFTQNYFIASIHGLVEMQRAQNTYVYSTFSPSKLFLIVLILISVTIL